MEVLVEAATQVPQGCFVSIRLGDNLKQRLGQEITQTTRV